MSVSTRLIRLSYIPMSDAFFVCNYLVASLILVLSQPGAQGYVPTLPNHLCPVVIYIFFNKYKKQPIQLNCGFLLKL